MASLQELGNAGGTTAGDIPYWSNAGAHWKSAPSVMLNGETDSTQARIDSMKVLAQAQAVIAAGGATYTVDLTKQIVKVSGTQTTGTTLILDFQNQASGLYYVDWSAVVSSATTATLQIKNGTATQNYTINTTATVKGGLLVVNLGTNALALSA